MIYKHWNIGHWLFGNTYLQIMPKRRFKVSILRYYKLYIFEFKYKSFGFDIGIKLK